MKDFKNLKSNTIRLLQEESLHFDKVKNVIEQDEDFGSGVIYVILGGILSVMEKQIHGLCKDKSCSNPLYIWQFKKHPSLIDQALNLHKEILASTKNDCVLFSGLIPLSFEKYNKSLLSTRPCKKIHTDVFTMPVECKINDELVLYNSFVRVHSMLLRYSSFNLDEDYDNFIQNFGLLLLKKDGFSFTAKLKEQRRKIIEANCLKLAEMMDDNQKNIFMLESNSNELTHSEKFQNLSQENILCQTKEVIIKTIFLFLE